MDFAAFESVDATSLRWLRRGESPLQFDLLAGERLVASLEWRAHGGTFATARTAQGSWTLKRVGFLNPEITVRPHGSNENVARLTAHLQYHRIELTKGLTYRFHRAGVLVPAWQVTEETGREVLHVEPVRDGRKLVGGAVLAPAFAPALVGFRLLLLVSWYFIALAWFEDEALATLEGTAAPAPPRAAAPGPGRSP